MWTTSWTCQLAADSRHVNQLHTLVDLVVPAALCSPWFIMSRFNSTQLQVFYDVCPTLQGPSTWKCFCVTFHQSLHSQSFILNHHFRLLFPGLFILHRRVHFSLPWNMHVNLENNKWWPWVERVCLIQLHGCLNIGDFVVLAKDKFILELGLKECIPNRVNVAPNMYHCGCKDWD